MNVCTKYNGNSFSSCLDIWSGPAVDQQTNWLSDQHCNPQSHTATRHDACKIQDFLGISVLRRFACWSKNETISLEIVTLVIWCIPLSPILLHMYIGGCIFADSERAGHSLLFYKEHRARGMVLGVFMWEIKEFTYCMGQNANVHLLMNGCI